MPDKSPARKKPARSARGEAARAKLKVAASAVLERVSYHNMRITDVTREAGVATGLFYHYFPDLQTLVQEVLVDFVGRFEEVEDIERGIPRGDWFGRIFAHHRLVVASYAEHPGLMRCLTQISDANNEFRQLWRRMQYRQLHLLVDLIPRIFPNSELGAAQAEMVVYALGSIGDGMLREYYIDRSESLRQLNLSEEEMAEWLAAIFYRGLFGANPPAEKLHHAQKILSLVR